MRNNILFIILLIGMVLVSGCGKKYCCEDVPFSETASQITQQELSKGWYWGSLDQKKPGTPEDWVHTLEGTRGARWIVPTQPDMKCDCGKY